MRSITRYLLVFSFLCISTALAAAQSGGERQRGFFFEGALGPAYTSYDAASDAAFAQAEALGASRIRVMVGLSLGYAVSPNLYVIGGVVGYGDRFYDAYNYVQLNTYFWNLGIRYYPFTTGLVLGIDAGLASMGVTSDIGISGTSAEVGFGSGILVAYDFGGRPTGFSFELGLRGDYANVGGSPMSGAALVLALLFK